MTEVIQTPQEPEGLRSADAALAKSHEYADDELWSVSRLKEEGRYWQRELNNPDRSARSLVDVDTLVSRIAFEVTLREREFGKFTLDVASE
jgi:hypothetical protein